MTRFLECVGVYVRWYLLVCVFFVVFLSFCLVRFPEKTVFKKFNFRQSDFFIRFFKIFWKSTFFIAFQKKRCPKM